MWCPVTSCAAWTPACPSWHMLWASDLMQALEAVPQGVEGLCLGGSTSVLPLDAFSSVPGLKILGLFLSLTQVLPGALRGLGQLRQLSFTCHHLKDFFLPPDASGNLSSLQPISGALAWIGTQVSSCLLLYGDLTSAVFTFRMWGSWQTSSQTWCLVPPLDDWTLDVLDLSFNKKLTMASPGALQGLKVGTLNLDHTMMTAAAVEGLGLQKPDALSVMHTD